MFPKPPTVSAKASRGSGSSTFRILRSRPSLPMIGCAVAQGWSASWNGTSTGRHSLLSSCPTCPASAANVQVGRIDDVACPKATGCVLECSHDRSPNPLDCHCMKNLLPAVGELQFMDSVADSLDKVALSRVAIGAVDRSRTKDREARRMSEGRLHRDVVVHARASRIRLVAKWCVLVDRERLRRERSLWPAVQRLAQALSA
jgi:hypothetical protein